LGFLSKYGKLKGYIAKGKVASDEVINVFNDFVKTLTKKTVIVVDNASIHTSKKFKANLESWQEQGLTIFYLPTYSPHLNIIETLWRFMKYTWIEYKAYLSFNNFKDYILKIFNNYGKNYKINFDNKIL
jgi:transposase